MSGNRVLDVLRKQNFEHRLSTDTYNVVANAMAEGAKFNEDLLLDAAESGHLSSVNALAFRIPTGTANAGATSTNADGTANANAGTANAAGTASADAANANALWWHASISCDLGAYCPRANCPYLHIATPDAGAASTSAANADGTASAGAANAAGAASAGTANADGAANAAGTTNAANANAANADVFDLNRMYIHERPVTVEGNKVTFGGQTYESVDCGASAGGHINMCYYLSATTSEGGAVALKNEISDAATAIAKTLGSDVSFAGLDVSADVEVVLAHVWARRVVVRIVSVELGKVVHFRKDIGGDPETVTLMLRSGHYTKLVANGL